MNTTRYNRDPFDTLLRLQDVFGPQTGQPREHVSSRVWSPMVDVYEDNEAIVIKADIPGMKQEDIDIEMNGDLLTIRGERKFEDEERRDNYVRVERQYGAFQRSFTIGVPIESEQIKATYRSGILELTIPKAEAVKPKKVQVSAE